MNPQQFQLALSQCIQQALQGGQMPPAVVIGILECIKLDLHARLVAMVKVQPAIEPAKRTPEAGAN